MDIAIAVRGRDSIARLFDRWCLSDTGRWVGDQLGCAVCAETEEIAERLAATLESGTVIAYRGGLGMGKTAFTRGLARGLGCRERVTSPTFTIVNEYDGAMPLFHFDMYRLEDANALFDIGWEDYLARGAVCAVEWSENVSDAFWGDEINVRIEKCGDTERIITIGEDGTC